MLPPRPRLLPFAPAVRPIPVALAAALAMLATCLAPADAAAQDVWGDAEAPSLELASDPEPPYAKIAVTADPVGAFFGDWALTVSVALDRYHAFYVQPRYVHLWERDGLGIELGYQVHPLGAGLDGLFIGVGGGVGAVDPASAVAFVWGAADAGYRFVWEGLVIGAAVGVSVTHRFEGQGVTEIAPRVSVELGYSWM